MGSYRLIKVSIKCTDISFIIFSGNIDTLVKKVNQPNGKVTNEFPTWLFKKVYQTSF